MRPSFAAGVGLLLASAADVAAQPYQYVQPRGGPGLGQPYFRSQPDRFRDNNWSSRGNTNPWTGQRGYSNPDRAAPRERHYAPPPRTYR